MGMVALRGTPGRLRRVGEARRDRLGLEGRAALFPQARNRSRFFRRAARRRRPDPDPAREAGGVDAACARRARIRAKRARSLRRRHERGFPRRLLRAADEQHAAEARASAAICYLDADVRARTNLTIIPSATCLRSCCSKGGASIGVRASIGGERREFRAREIVLCAGGILSPVLLMRSGIGPADELRELGIEVRADRPGVGRNLQNHPVLFFGAQLRPRSAAIAMRCARCRCRASGCRPDCRTARRPIFASTCRANRPGTRPAGRSPISVRCCGSRSRAGSVSLPSNDARIPLVEFNFLDDERDLRAADARLPFRRSSFCPPKRARR